ncbi:MAG: hypothetical protein AAF748_02065 [Pseudomonadota bacterium]
MIEADDPARVSRRQVFYIPGYDPIHPRRYRELYRREGAAQAAISGYDLTLTPRQGGRYGWGAAAKVDGAQSSARFDVLVWADIVRASMARGIAGTYLALIRTVWTYLRTGTLRRLMWLRKGPVLAAFYPVVMLIGQALGALGVGALLAHGAAAIAGWLYHSGASLIGLDPSVAAWPLGLRALWWAVFVAVAVALLRWFKAQDSRFYAYYLMHDYAFACRYGGAYAPALQDRLAEFADAIADALDSDVDEVLVVGHSSGAYLAVSILADLLRQGRVAPEGPALSLLTLGQVIPMVSFLPKATQLRADLHLLAASERMTWVDVSAPGDGCAFALSDPVAVSGVAPAGQLWPLVVSAAFTQSLSPETWRALRWRFFRLHFQYLCAFDAPKDYDYFQITAGPLTLGARYRARASSKSRIDVAASRYTSMAA